MKKMIYLEEGEKIRFMTEFAQDMNFPSMTVIGSSKNKISIDFEEKYTATVYVNDNVVCQIDYTDFEVYDSKKRKLYDSFDFYKN